MQIKSIDNMKALRLKIFLSHCFSTQITTLFVYSKILIHLRHWDQNKQKGPPFIPSPHLLYFTDFSDPLFIKTPSLFGT